MDNLDSPLSRDGPRRDLPSRGDLTPSPVVGTEACADFGEFYRGFVPPLVVFLLWQGARLGVAADITQQTMTTMCQRWLQINDPPRWARTTASRALARHIARVDNPDPEQFATRPGLVPAWVDGHAWHDHHDILTMLEVLSPRQRQVMAWTLGGYSTADIAGQLQLTRVAVAQTRNEACAGLAVCCGHQHSPHLIDSDSTSPVVEVEVWLAGHYQALINEVSDSLEIPTALREVLTPSPRGEPGQCCDDTTRAAMRMPVDPAATQGPFPRPLAADSAVVTGCNDAIAASATPHASLLSFLQVAATWGPGMRLAVRSHPVFGLTRFSDRVHALIGTLDTASDLASVLARAVDCVVRRTLDRALAHDPAVLGDPDQAAVARDLGLARDIGRQLDRDLDQARKQARHLAGDLADDLGCVRDLAVLPCFDLDYILDRILALPRTSNYARLGARSLADDLAGVHAAVDDLRRVGGFAHDLAHTIQALSHLHQVLSDVSGLDLRDIDLTEIALQGLRWSPATRWPPQLHHQIRRASTPIADQLFQIGPPDTTDLSTTA